MMLYAMLLREKEKNNYLLDWLVHCHSKMQVQDQDTKMMKVQQCMVFVLSLPSHFLEQEHQYLHKWMWYNRKRNTTR